MRSAPGRHRAANGRTAPRLILAPFTPGPPGIATRPDTATVTDADHGDSAWAARLLRTLAGIFVVTWSFRLSGYLTFAPWLSVPVALLGLGGLVAVVAAWLPTTTLSARRQQQIGWGVLFAALIALGLWSYFQVFVAPDYGTDEMAFDQYAAQLALQGINPYLHSMAQAFPLFHVSPNGYTFQLNGQPITTLSYPALSFEAYLPLLALGIRTQAAVWIDVAAWAVSAIVLHAVLPRRLAALAVIVVSADVYIGYAVGGITDFLYLPFLVGTAVRWDKFAVARGPAAWRGPVLMGLAMSVKQTPWLIVPFVVAGIVMESKRACGDWRRAARDGLRYCGIAAGAFLVTNLPFLVQAPGAWLRGVLTPMSSQAVPAGQGLISLSLSLPVGGGSLRAYNLAAAVVFAAILACFVTAYPALKPAAFLLPSIVLFFATRSFGSYLIMLFPAAIAAAASTTRLPAACWPRWRWTALGGAAASGLAITFALTAASPLTMSIRSVRTTGQLATVEQVTLAVTNNTGHPLRPSFTIADGTMLTAFWRRDSGPPVLGPHQRARYTIQAPSYFAMPSISNGFQVLAFSSSPPSVSRSTAYVPSLWRVVLDPATVNHLVARGQQVTVRAEIVNRLDEPVQVANVPVYLGQVIYAQRGLQFSEAVINQGLPGQTPVEALTNAAGVATFTIHSPYASTEPVYFEANLVNPASFYPYGYSPILAVRFRA
ncbi:MAG TPA: hypothetical protein VNF47_06375 [Streptosporangiaceae bacterium]|nr:hypothetical protein [Streptosporangiaceae bacterium]